MPDSLRQEADVILIDAGLLLALVVLGVNQDLLLLEQDMALPLGILPLDGQELGLA